MQHKKTGIPEIKHKKTGIPEIKFIIRIMTGIRIKEQIKQKQMSSLELLGPVYPCYIDGPYITVRPVVEDPEPVQDESTEDPSEDIPIYEIKTLKIFGHTIEVSQKLLK